MANSTDQQENYFEYTPQMAATDPPDQFDDFRAYMRYAMQADANRPLAAYPAPELVATSEATFNECGKPTNALASYNGDRASQSKQLLTELQSDMATAIAQTASVQWNGKAPEKLAFVQIPQRVWRDIDDLEDLPELFWNSGQLELEFPKGFENGQLISRGKVLFFGVSFKRELVKVNVSAHVSQPKTSDVQTASPMRPKLNRDNFKELERRWMALQGKESLDRDKAWEWAKAEFPNHHVTKQNVADMRGPQMKGPRPK